MPAHYRSMRRFSTRRSRASLRHLKDARCKAANPPTDSPRPNSNESPGPISAMFTGIASALNNMFSNCEGGWGGGGGGGEVMVRGTMVPRGRKLRSEDYEELGERVVVGFKPLMEGDMILVPTREEIIQGAKGGKDELFFPNEENHRLRIALHSQGQARWDWLLTKEEIQLDALNERLEIASGKPREEGKRLLFSQLCPEEREVAGLKLLAEIRSSYADRELRAC